MRIISIRTITSWETNSHSTTFGTVISSTRTLTTLLVTRWTDGFVGIIVSWWAETIWRTHSVSSTFFSTGGFSGTSLTHVTTRSTDKISIFIISINTWTMWSNMSVFTTFVTLTGFTKTGLTFRMTSNNDSRSDWDVFNMNGSSLWWEHWALWWWVMFWSTGQTEGSFVLTSRTYFAT